MKNDVKNILLILTHREKKRLLFVTLADILINVLDIVFLAALLVIINYYTQQNYPSAHFGFLYEAVEKHYYLLITDFFLLFSLKNFFGFFVIRKQNHFVYQVALRISGNTLSDYLSSDYQNYAGTDSSVHVRKISQQAIQFGQYILLNFQQIISQSVLITITTAAILLFNAKLFLLLVVIIIPPVVLTAWLMKKKLQTLRLHAKINSEKSIQHLAEALNGYVESVVYDKREFFTKRFEQFQKKLNYHIADQQAIQGFPSRLIEIFAILGLCVLIVLTKQNANTGMPVLLIGAFMGSAYKIIPGIVKILNSSGQIKAYHFTITDLLKHNYALVAPAQNADTKISTVEFDNIFFDFNEKNILSNISFKVNRGDFAGISGISGRGKTTIINLLIGFLDPSSGSIKINNCCSEKTVRRSFLKNISYAKQQPFFIHDTVLKNILFDEENHDAKRLNEILVATGVDSIIAAHEKGLHYQILENGKNISGGERQRIVFARTLYKKSDLIILDEPFSELDESSEIKLIEYLRQLAHEGKMIILISHNKNSLSYCNKIITLDD